MTSEGLSSSILVRKERLAGAALVVLLLSCISTILNYWKMYITTSTFGATASYDAFLVAFTPPDIISNILMSAMGVVFVPLYSECANKEGSEKALDFLDSIFTWTLLSTLFISVLFVLLSPWIVRAIAPGLDEKAQGLAAQLMVIMVPVIATTALARLMMGFLHVQHNFSIPALGGVINLLVTILCIYLLSKGLGIGSFAIGIALGAVARLLLQLSYTFRRIKGYGLSIALPPATKKFALAMLPLVLGASIFQLGIVVERALASHLPGGSISYLGYASSLMLLPSEVLMGAIGTVLFPVLSQQAVLGDWQEFRRTFSAGIRMGNLILIPLALGFLFFGRLIIQVLFERGQFVPSMTEGTANALAFYSIGLLVWAPFTITQYCYFALQRYRTVVKITLPVTAVGILLRFVLVRPLAHMGLALSTSLTFVLYTVVLLWCLMDVLEEAEIKEILISFCKVLFSSLAAVYGAAFVGSYLNHVAPLLQLLAIVVTVGTLYSVLIYLLGVKEFYYLLELGRNFLMDQTAVKNGKFSRENENSI